ncbi:hypothetical protein [Nocardioides pantholopis]|uniref:hypothetical protein n=1 Tax=Nocardioides pantholopis TaxID=2483798 RepID=UPI000F091E62|nr:hypothetical protein [Nocardioides pantholopis]
MAESAEEVHRRVAAAEPLPLPDVAEWPTFPWTVVDGRLAVRHLAGPQDEPARAGEDGRSCPLCGDQPGTIWVNDNWRVKHLPQRSGLPLVLVLEPLEHLDLPDLDDAMAGEHGRISVWLARIMERLPHVGRVHVSRWGDGCEHLHTWFHARTERLTSLRGSFSVDWDEVLPPGPEDVWRADLAAVAARLATHDGRALV